MDFNKKIEIAGKEIPVWVLIVGGAVALVGLYIGSTRAPASSDQGTATPAASDQTPGATDPSAQITASVQDAQAQIAGLVSAGRDQIASDYQQSQAANEKARADLFAQFRDSLAQMQSEQASARSSITAESYSANSAPVFQSEIDAQVAKDRQMLSSWRAADAAQIPPASPAISMQTTLAQINAALDRKGGIYTVQSGDNLSQIALANGLGLADLISKNPQIKNPNLIYPGQAINL